jgi:tetratricopeptide (TPR) repeat protein
MSDSLSSPGPLDQTIATPQPPAPSHSELRRRFPWLRGCWPSPRRLLVLVAALAALVFAAYSIGRQYWASRHYRAALSEYEQHHYDRAKQHLENAYAVWPEDPGVLMLAARISRRRQSFDQAQTLLDRYHQARGEDDDLLLERVLLRAERGDVQGAVPFCKRLLDENHAQSARILEALAAGYLRIFRLDDAQRCLKLWQEREPNNAHVHYMSGSLHEVRGQLREAVIALRRAVELDAEHEPARFRLAVILIDQSEARAALPHLRLLMEQQPAGVAVLTDLARCLDQLGEEDEAETLLDRALALNPRHAGALRERGLLAVRKDQPERAEIWLRQACTLAPGDYKLHYQLMLCLQRLGKDDEVRALQPLLKQLLEDATRMRSLLEEVSLTPSDAALLQELGAIALRAGSLDQGLRWFEAALQADPHHAATHESLARHYQQTGQLSRAATHRELAKRKSP